MTKGDVTSAAQKVRGSVKEAIGKLTGNSAAEEQGASEKAKAEGQIAKPPADGKANSPKT